MANYDDLTVHSDPPTPSVKFILHDSSKFEVGFGVLSGKNTHQWLDGDDV